MAARYWVGGTAAWDGTAGTKWALTSGGAGGQAIPTAADDVFFSNLSTGTCTISTGNTGAKSITCTGFTGTLTGTAAITVSGSVTLVAGMTFTYTGTLTINGTGTLTSAGKTLGATTINGSGITVTLGDAITVNGPLTLTTGTFTTNNFNVTAYNFSSSGVLVRTLNMGSSTWTLNAQYSGPDHWTVSTTTNLTLNAGTSTINCTYIGGGTNSFFRGGGLTYYILKNSNVSTSALTLSGSNTFNDLVNGNTTRDSSFVFSAGTTQTFTNFTYSNTAPYTTSFKSTIGGSTFTLSKASGTVNLSRMLILDSVASGGATWNATDSVNIANNTGWNFTASTGRYWVGGTASWDGTAGTKWALTSGGAGGATIPGSVDPVYFDAASGANTVTIATGNIGCAGFVCAGFTGTLTGTAALSVYGNVTLVSGMTYTYTGTITFTGTATVTSAGKTFGNVTINNAGITVTLGAALTQGSTSTNIFTLTQGTLDLNGFTLTCGIFSSSNTNTRAISFGAGGITLTHSTSTSTTVLSMATMTGFSWTGSAGTEGFSYTRNVTTGIGTITAGSTAGGTVSNAVNVTLRASTNSITTSVTSGSYIKNLTFAVGTGVFNIGSCTYNACGNLDNFIADLRNASALIPQFLASGTLRNGGTVNALGNVTVNGSGITVTLIGPCALGPTRTFVLAAGTLDLAGYTLSTGIFSSSGSATRSITFGSSNIALISATASVTVLAMATATGFTWTGTGGFTRNQAATATMVFGTTGGTVSNAPNLTVNAGVSALTLTTGSYFKNVSFSGSTSTVTASYYACGNLTLGGGTYTSVLPVFLVTATVTSTGKTLGNTTVSGSGITVTLADALTLGATSSFQLTQGTLDLAGFTLSTGAFTSTNSNTRTINFGTGVIALTSTTTATTVLSMATATGFTWTGTGGFTRNQAATATMVFGNPGGTESNAPNLTVNAGAFALTITSASWFGKVDFTGSTCTVSGSFNMAGDLTLATGGTYTSLLPAFRTSSTITSNGKTLGNTTVLGAGITVTLAGALTLGAIGSFQLAQGTLDLAGFNLSTGVFTSDNSNTRSVAFGTASIELTNASAGVTVLSMATATGFSYTGTPSFTRNQAATATVTFGTTGGTVSNAPSLTVNAGASALTITAASWFKNMDFTGSTCTVTASTLNMAGNLTLDAGGTYTSVVPTFLATATVTSNGKTLGNTTVNAPAGTVTLADAFTLGTSSTLTLTAGTLSTSWPVSVGLFSSSNSNTRTLDMGSVGLTWTITGSGASAWDTAIATGLTLIYGVATISMTSSLAKTFNGGGLTTYYVLNQGGAGALTITDSNTFNTITNSIQPTTVTFTAGTTQTVSNFGLSGTAGNLVTINSSTPGTQFTLSKPSGTVSAKRLSIQDSNATGGANWYATDSIDTSNNTGWIFNNTNGMLVMFS